MLYASRLRPQCPYAFVTFRPHVYRPSWIRFHVLTPSRPSAHVLAPLAPSSQTHALRLLPCMPWSFGRCSWRAQYFSSDCVASYRTKTPRFRALRFDGAAECRVGRRALLDGGARRRRFGLVPVPVVGEPGPGSAPSGNRDHKRLVMEIVLLTCLHCPPNTKADVRCSHNRGSIGFVFVKLMNRGCSKLVNVKAGSTAGPFSR